MWWVIWLLVANFSIAFIEYIYRVNKFDDFLQALPSLFLPILIAQMGLFYGYKLAPSLLMAGAVFTLMNMILRVGNVFILGERFGWTEFFAVLLMVGAIFLLKIK